MDVVRNGAVAGLPSRYEVRKVDVEEGLAKIHRAGLFIDDEETSRVLYLLYAHHEDGPAKVQHVWLAHDNERGADVGMAMLSSPADDSDGLPVLNTYVDPSHQGQGVGKALLEAMVGLVPASQVAAYYTHDAVRLYQAFGFRVAEFHYGFNGVKEALVAKDVERAERLHIEAKLKGRLERDEERKAPPRYAMGLSGPNRR